jgi:hypothetical protein
MIEYLEDCGDVISNELLNLRRTDTGIDMTFVDVDDVNPGFVTFFKMDTAKKLASKIYPSDILDRDLNDSSSNAIFLNSIAGQGGRSSIRLGRFINKITKEKFKPIEIETFVNKFKSTANMKKEEFILVSGPEIEKWYRKEMIVNGPGSIQGSCMTGMSGVFDLYTENPKSCQLLVLTHKGKAIARALVWKVHECTVPMEYFMDRVYYTHEYQVQSFKLYAKKMGWGIRNNYNDDDITIGDREYFISDIQLRVKVKPKNYKRYPYLDTISVYDPSKGILYPNLTNSNNMIVLKDTRGRYVDNRTRTKRIVSRFRDFFTP